MSDEALEIIIRLWTEDEPITYEGTFSKGIDLIVEPKPLQKPYPELWWAGDAEVSVPRAAKYAHSLELTWPTPSMAKLRADALAKIVAEEAPKYPRDIATSAMAFAEVRETDYTREQLLHTFKYPVHNDDLMDSVIAGSPAQCANVVHQFADAGVTHLALDFNRHGLDPVRQIHTQMEEFATKVVPLL
jgi:alkanesulfonate monooxygenase SsuD/methylene tetrahydromethanopterin reductase-like flavin-dependent oxidoreductase (luciferase family)